MYNVDCVNKIVQCPFNKFHVMPRSRLQRHIVKCEKNYPQDCNIICPYNASHRLNRRDIKEHIEICPTRKIIEASYVQY